MLFQYHIREMTVETSAEDFVTHFVHVEKFMPFCQQCSSYNTRWTCPHFAFDPMTIWRSYTGLRLYARILQADVPEQPLDEDVYKRQKLDNCPTRNEFVEKALRQYCGRLHAERTGAYLPRALQAVSYTHLDVYKRQDQEGVREMTKPLFAIPPHQFLFNPGSIGRRFYICLLYTSPSWGALPLFT